LDDPTQKLLRSILGVASHLDGIVCEQGKAIHGDVAAVLLADLTRIGQELGWLADDVEIRLPRRQGRVSR
jgi:hypothetical protein